MTIRNLPPLAQLRAFAALAETGSVGTAGDLLNVSHAAISQQVRALEQTLGLPLTMRDGRSVRLTPEGERLGQILQSGLGQIIREIESLTGANNERPVQLTTTPMFAADWLMRRLGAFRQAHPDVDISLNPTVDRVDLSLGGAELAIRFGRGTWPGLTARLLVPTSFVIAGATSLVGDRTAEAPGDLTDLPWLQEIGTTETNEWLRRHGITQKQVTHISHMPGHLLLDGLRRGQGIAVTSRAFVQADIARGDVVELYRDTSGGMGYFLLSRPGVMRPATRALANWLTKTTDSEREKGDQIAPL